MVVTLLIDDKRTEVDNSLLRTSETVTNLLSDLQLTDVEFTIPSQYSTSVVSIYLDFVNKISYNNGEVVYPDDLPVVDNVNTLLSCFRMESLFADNAFFVYLMKQAYGIWDDFLLVYPIPTR